MERVESAVEQIPALRIAIETADKRMQSLSQRDEELADALRKISDTHLKAFDGFSEMLQKQRQEGRDTLIKQEDRWRDSLRELSKQHAESNERIAEETLSRISGIAMRGTIGTVLEWARPVALAAVIAAFGWFIHSFIPALFPH